MFISTKELKIVNTNLGILLIYLFSSFFAMADFIIIDYVFDKCVGSNFNLDGVIDNKKDDENKVDIYIECSRSLVNKSILLDVKLI